MEILTSYIIKGNPDIQDEALAGDIRQALGTSFETHISRVVDMVRDTVKGRIGSHLHVRCYRTSKLKQGLCFKFSGGRPTPDIILGFTGDVDDFTITLIHELLHLFRWDEKTLEKKAKEIYYNDRRAQVPLGI